MGESVDNFKPNQRVRVVADTLQWEGNYGGVRDGLVRLLGYILVPVSRVTSIVYLPTPAVFVGDRVRVKYEGRSEEGVVQAIYGAQGMVCEFHLRRDDDIRILYYTDQVSVEKIESS